MLDPDVVKMPITPLQLLKYHRRWTFPTFYIATPDYTYLHSGVRCLHLLCHHLNRLGYRAFVTTPHTNPELRTPYAEPPADRRSSHIVVYPEVFEGNRYDSRRVVRYLLNKPGVLSGFGVEAFGEHEYFIHFLDAFRPEGLTSRQLRIPLVDSAVFHPPKVRKKRKGFVLYSVRNRLNPSSLPRSWRRNCVTVTRANPRTPAQLAELYRERRAFITGERTAAAIEAMHCGCPILLIPNPNFDVRPTVDFFEGNGIGIGADKVQLQNATRSLGKALDRYAALHRQLDDSIHGFVKDACRHFRQIGA